MSQSTSVAVGHGEAVEMVSRPSATASSGEGIVGKDLNTNTETTKVLGSEESLEDQDEMLRLSKSTYDDLKNMRRMGKEQLLTRNFRVMSLAAFSAMCTAAWEIGLFLLTPGLINGGRAGLVWNLIWNFIGFGPV